MARLPTSTFPIRHTQDKLSRYMRSLYLTNDTFSSLSWRKFKGVDKGKKFPLSVSSNLFWCIMKQLVQSFLLIRNIVFPLTAPKQRSHVYKLTKIYVLYENNTIRGTLLLLLILLTVVSIWKKELITNIKSYIKIVADISKTFPLPHAASITSWFWHKTDDLSMKVPKPS